MADRLPGPTRATVVSAALAGTRPTAKPSGVSTRSGGDFGSNRLERHPIAPGERSLELRVAPEPLRGSLRALALVLEGRQRRVEAGFETVVDAARDAALGDGAESPECSGERHDGQRQEGADQLDLEAPQHVFALQFPDSLPISPL